MGSQVNLPEPVRGPASQDPDARRILDALRWIVRDLRVGAGSPAWPSGFSAAQLFVLHTLLREPAGLSLGELAARTVTDLSSVSVVVRKLHLKKLVRKRPSPVDRRRTEVSLTAAGRRLAEASPLPAQATLVARIGALPPRDRVRLAGLLERIAPRGRAAAPMFFDDSPGEADAEGADD
ncbi:MAG: MarR family winged helix-turn-helix transcriptional regulator [Holophagaceae bacterium]